MDDSIYFDGRHYDALWPGLQRRSELEFYLRRIRKSGDCRNFTLDRQFGPIFFPANALLQLLSWEDLQACLQQVKQHL